MNSGTTIEFNSVSRSFPKSGMVLERINFRIKPGEFVVLLGPSGSGKSTLLRLAAGLDKPNQGSVEGVDNSTNLAFVFQESHLLPWRTVHENVRLPFELSRSAIAASAVSQSLEKFGLKDAAHLYPAALSGGMKMRASLARALVTNPQVLLLDEPFAALDEPSRFELQVHLRKLWLAQNMTILFVTHSLAEAAFLGDRALVLSGRPARVVADIQNPLPESRTDQLRLEAPYWEHVKALSLSLKRGTPG
jgi:NitT/TauT family transport system ATP-binding protein